MSARAPDAYDTIIGEGVVDFVAVFRTIREIQIPSDASISIEYEANLEAYDDVALCIENATRAARDA